MKTTPATLEIHEPRWGGHLSVYTWMLVASWTACVAGSLAWSLLQERREVVEEARSAAKMLIVQDILYRRWAAGEEAGSAIVDGSASPGSERPLHPHESAPPPIFSQGATGPASMAPTFYEPSSVTGSVQSHLVSLNPIDSKNAPDAWEAQGLKAFLQGVPEVSRQEGQGRGAHLHLMRPFLTEKACLACHEAQGYKVGDIRGGISVSVPVAPFWAIGNSRLMKIALTHLLLWIIGLAGIGVGSVHLRGQFSMRRRVEEELRAASVYARSLIEASLDPLVTISAEGKITDVNAATEAVTGHSREDLIGTDFSDYFTEPEKARAGYKQVFKDGVVRDYPLDLHHRDGRVTPVLYNASVYKDEAGKVVGVFAAARDITERRRMEDLLRESEARLLYAQRLGHIGNWDWNLQTNELHWSDENYRIFGFPPEVRPSIEAFMDTVDNVDRELVTQAIQDALGGKKSYDIDMHIVGRDGVKRIVNAQAEVSWNETGKPVRMFGTVQTIPDRLQRTFVHLIENALQNSPQNGRVRVHLGQSGGQAIIAVIDEGSGIPEKIRDHLFEPFVTTHTGRRGLGLALTKHYVESMGGTIEAANNDPAPGATFIVRFRMEGLGTEAEEGGTSQP